MRKNDISHCMMESDANTMTVSPTKASKFIVQQIRWLALFVVANPGSRHDSTLGVVCAKELMMQSEGLKREKRRIYKCLSIRIVLFSHNMESMVVNLGSGYRSGVQNKMNDR
jgi:hypothetical protein